MPTRTLSPWLAVAGVILFTTAAEAAAKRPNVVLVMSDDQGYGDFSCHGNPVLKTPNLDKLHAEGVRLADFHVAPMCTPTRGQLLSGIDALRNSASSVSAGRSRVRRDIPLMPEYFRAAGYRTAMFGKWHLGDNDPDLPHRRGFDEAVYHLGWGITSMADRWGNDLFDGRFRHNGVLKPYKGYCTDVWFDLGINWMKERAAKREPFFLYLPTNAPHGPHWVPARYKKPYEGKGPAAFYGMIANIDENVGRLEKFLTESGLRDDTVVIYLHDNGGTAGVKRYNAGMRAGKTTYYEGGHRAACFIRWPNGKLTGGRDVGGLTQVQDLLPTLVDLCGLKKPEGPRLDGVSLAGPLRGQGEVPDRTLVVQYGEQPNRPVLEKWHCAVMQGPWRLVHGKELYDLRTDPAQQQDAATKQPEVVKRLRDHYEQWWGEVGPLTEQFVPVVIGSDAENPATLTSADWVKVYCDNMNQLRQGVARNGPWHVLPAKDGEYEISLRRWPKEADAPIAAGVPAFKAVDGELPAGKALPVAKVRLKVAGLDETRPVTASDKEVTFTVRLKGGETVPAQSWLLDADGKELCGAYFAYVRRK